MPQEYGSTIDLLATQSSSTSDSASASAVGNNSISSSSIPTKGKGKGKGKAKAANLKLPIVPQYNSSYGEVPFLPLGIAHVIPCLQTKSAD